MPADRTEALARLEMFVGEWAIEPHFPGGEPGPPADADVDPDAGPRARAWFEWTLDRQFLLQRTEVPVPEAPDSLALVSVDLDSGAYRQHYYDSRGVTRLYAMTFDGRVWTLTREEPDFTPLEFGQRFTATFSEDATTIRGAWEKCLEGDQWEHDFNLTYRKVR